MITPPHRTVLGTFFRAGPSSVRGPGLLSVVQRLGDRGGRLGFASLLVVAGFACGDPNDPQPTTGSMSGTVKDAETGAPLHTAMLVVEGFGLTGETGSDGSYRIDNIPAGTYQVSVSRHRYLSRTVEAEVRAGSVIDLSTELTRDPAYGPVLSVTTSSLPHATVDVPYEAELEASGGTPPYAWSWGSQGPPGLLLDALGLVAGTPEYPAGSHPIRLTVRDSEGQTAWRDVTIEIVAASGLRVSSLELRQGEAGAAYADTLRASGGAPPYTFEWSEPAELDGLELETATGALSGTPIRPTGPDGEPATATVTVHDAAGASAIAEVALGVRPAPLVIVTESLPDGVVGEAYEAPLEARGGYGSRTWTVTVGIFPPGLTLYSDESLFGARVQGRPTVAGTFTFTLRASDGRSQATREYTVEIVEPAIQRSGSGTRSGASSTNR